MKKQSTNNWPVPLKNVKVMKDKGTQVGQPGAMHDPELNAKPGVKIAKKK